MNPLALLLAVVSAAPAPRHAASVTVPGYGAVEVLGARVETERAVVLLSGAEGPDASARALAEGLAAGGALVAIVDTRAYLAARATARCAYPAGDLEIIAQRVQKVRGRAAYDRPVLVGHGRGAAVAWAALAQAPAGTFAGVVLVAPCAEEPLPLRLCQGSGPPARRLADGELPALVPPPGRIEVVAGGRDGACPAPAAATLARTLGARYAEVSSAGQGLDATAVGAACAAAARVAADPRPEPRPPPPISDLPLVEVPSATPGPRLALLLTGDGGWVAIDKALAAAFAAEGVSVVGLDSLRYFWKRRTPEEVARDAARILAYYRERWGRPETLLVGYSRGADIVPIVAGRLPPEERARVKLVAMLGPSTFAELEVHAIDLFSSRKRAGALSTEEAVRATGGTLPMLCVHGTEEHDSLCPRLADLPWVKRVLLPGGHHFDGGYVALARRVLEAVP
jgi:type IV secretory pathway VirJ component